jgi:hypothetical protein
MAMSRDRNDSPRRQRAVEAAIDQGVIEELPHGFYRRPD